MKKKGFTLIEMLAVIVILGIILIVAIPQIQNQLANKKDEVNKATLQMIYDATEIYTASDPSTFQKLYNNETNRSVYCITLKELVDAGKLESPIKDFKTGDELNLSYQVRAITNKYNEFEYAFVKDENPIECYQSYDVTQVETYKDETLPVNGGTYPTIYSGMIPVVYKNGYWVKASLYEEWYNYTKGNWANAVTVNVKASSCDGNCIDTAQKHSRDYYLKAKAGTKISMDDINGMYVWIPKFEYKITAPYGISIDGKAVSATSPGMIEISFIEKNKTKASSSYNVHPAFTFGEKALGGIWVAKFEASPESTSKCALNGINCNSNETKFDIVPNRNSWKNISLLNAYKVTSSMKSNTNYYGLKPSVVNTHLMKNNEWGAVAYLSQSAYGRYGVSNGKEIFVNKYYKDATLTGCTAGKAGTNINVMTDCKDNDNNKLNYNYEASYSGSTSGTIYGIFDMSGGLYEYVMGNYNRFESKGGIPLNDVYEEVEKINEETNEPYTEQVLKVSKINDKYVDIYNENICSIGECVGSALLKSEFNLSGSNWWLDEYNLSVNEDNSWLIRGGSYNINSSLDGIFAVSTTTGEPSDKIGFRPVIVGAN